MANNVKKYYYVSENGSKAIPTDMEEYKRLHKLTTVEDFNLDEEMIVTVQERYKSKNNIKVKKGEVVGDSSIDSSDDSSRG